MKKFKILLIINELPPNKVLFIKSNNYIIIIKKSDSTNYQIIYYYALGDNETFRLDYSKLKSIINNTEILDYTLNDPCNIDTTFLIANDLLHS